MDRTVGLAWILLAGITQGSFILPMKFVRRWKWEHLWLVYSVVAFFVLPLVTAFATVPQLWRVYGEAPTGVLWMTGLFGTGWGAGSVFFGLGVDALGMALGFSIMTGMYTALGALVPLIVLTPQLLWTRNGLLVIAGNAVTIVGVVVCAIAGDLRDKQFGTVVAGRSLNPRVPFSIGLSICVAAGVLSGMLNFSYAFGAPIADAACRLGATKEGGLNALWLVAIPAGGILNVGYCLYLLRRRKSWSVLWRKTFPLDWVNACIMAGLWTGSIILYGRGANNLGPLGPSLGWSLWNAILIITTVACGLLTREWNGARGRPLRLLLIGIGILLAATALLGLGGAGG